MSSQGLSPNPTVKDLQKYVNQVSKERGFDKETLQERYILLTEEVGELAKAIRKISGVKIADDSLQTVAEDEVADILWMLIWLCSELEIDIADAFHAKEAKNKKRNWA